MKYMNQAAKYLFTINSAAELLDVSRGLIYRWMKTGQLKYVLVGNDRRIPASELERIAAEGIPSDSKTENKSSV